MNKLEYLEKLEACLKKRRLSKAEIDDIIRDYAEYFEEGRRQSKPDQEIAAKLGDPELVADQIMEENGHSVSPAPIDVKKEWKESKETIQQWQVGDKASGCLTALLKVMGILILIPVFLVVGVTSVFVLASAFMALIGCFSLPIAGAVLAIFGFVCAAMSIHFLSLPVGLLCMLGSLSLLSLSVCIGVLLIMAVRGCWRMTRRAVSYVHRRLFSEKQPETAAEIPVEEADDHE